MNQSDAAKVLAFFQELLARNSNKDKPVVAFSLRDMCSTLRNTRVSQRNLENLCEDVNDMLSITTVCKTLGAIFTICPYELDVMFLIRADLAHTDNIKLFDPATKVRVS